jgi:hypothetical protein
MLTLTLEIFVPRIVPERPTISIRLRSNNRSPSIASMIGQPGT